MATQTMWSYRDSFQRDDQRRFSIKHASAKNCWEIVREVDASSYNVCSDCLVYVAKHKNSVLSQREIDDIVTSRGADSLNGTNCQQLCSAIDK